MSIAPKVAHGIQVEGFRTGRPQRRRSAVDQRERPGHRHSPLRGAPNGTAFLDTWDILSPDHGIAVRINGRLIYDGSSGLSGALAALDLTWLPSGSKLHVEIDSDVLHPPGDPRTLGVPLRGLALILHGGTATDRKLRWHNGFAWSPQNLFKDAASLRAFYFTGGEPMLDEVCNRLPRPSRRNRRCRACHGGDELQPHRFESCAFGHLVAICKCPDIRKHRWLRSSERIYPLSFHMVNDRGQY